jgi:CBS domain-containing protein
MVPWNRVVTIGVDETADDLRALMSSNHSRFPFSTVMARSRGSCTPRTCSACRGTATGRSRYVDLVHEVLAVPEAAALAVVLSELRARSTEMAIVIDEYGAPAGVVTLEDIVEELVGDIEDEYDPTAPGDYTELEPGVWIVDALSRTDEIERVTGYDLRRVRTTPSPASCSTGSNGSRGRRALDRRWRADRRAGRWRNSRSNRSASPLPRPTTTTIPDDDRHEPNHRIGRALMVARSVSSR